MTPMLSITVSADDVRDVVCDLLVAYARKDHWEKDGVIARLDEAFGGRLKTFLRQERFDGSRGSRVFLPTFGCLKARKICIIGLGETSDLKAGTWRTLGGHIAKAAKEAKTKCVASVIPAEVGIGIS